MNLLLHNYSAVLNNIGRWFCNYGTDIFIQSGILIILLLIIDFLLRKRIRATFRYWIWMLVLLKLMLPPTFSLPTGIGSWFGDYIPAQTSISKQVSNTTRLEHAGVSAPQDPSSPAETTQVILSRSNPEPAAPALPVISDFQTLTWQAVVFVIWFIGVTLLLLLLVHRILFVRRLIAQSDTAKEWYADILVQCRQQLSIKRKTELRLSEKLQSPAVCGFFRPVILMPAGLLGKLSPDKLRAVLIHELAHIKRGDLWVNCVQTFLQIIYFYNPLVWLANAIIHGIREQAVDEMVLVTLGAGARSYSNTLIDIAEMSFLKASLTLRLIGVVESKKALSRRIKHILNRPIPKSAKLGALGLVVIILSAAVLLPMARADKKDPTVVQPDQTNEQFIAELTNGVRVELVGLFTGQSKEDLTWWRPDGTSMSKQEYALYEGKIKSNNIRHLETWQFEYGYILCFNPLDVSVMVDVTAGMQSTFGHPRNDGFSINYVESYEHLREEGLPKIGDIGVAVAYGPFTPMGLNRGSMGSSFRVGLDAQSFSLDDGSTIILTSVRPDHFGPGSGLLVDAIANANDLDINVLYESKEGKVNTAEPHSLSGSSLISTIQQPKPMIQRTFRLRSIKQEDLKRIAVEYRRYKSVYFKNVALKPNVKTDVQIETEKSDVLRVPSDRYPTIPSAVEAANEGDKIVADSSAMKDNIPEQNKPDVQTEEMKELKTILLPDVDSKGLMLDLVSSKLVKVPKADTPENISSAIDKLNKGDIIFDASSLILVRGATSGSLPDTTELFKTYKIGQRLPEIFNLKTKEGVEWTIEILSIDKNVCRLQYYPVHPNNYVSAIPLTTLEHELFKQVPELFKQVEKKYPEQSMHTSAGSHLYHVDAQGRVTIWCYQRLGHRSTDCASDEVGWGSSRLVDAKGMYYLPDGTPLQSRWRWRNNIGGMTDIRVKLGRNVTEDEHVGLVSRHELSSDNDLYSRDGRERKIMIQPWKSLPVAIIVRVDRPYRLHSLALGDVEADTKYLDEYDQLLVTAPPENNTGPMLVTIQLPQ